VLLYGVVNASPDSLNEDSIVRNAEEAVARARQLLREGADAIDIGGQGSTDAATVVPWQAEWERLAEVIPAVAALGIDVSVDTWRPEVAHRALEAGATVINAADGMQTQAMWEVAAEHRVPIVVPFLSGPNPREMALVGHDPIAVMLEFFDVRLAEADRYGVRDLCIVDPGTGFAPPNWPWEQRYEYQKVVYNNLGELRRYGLPVYIALPWKETAQHDELLEIVLRQRPEYGRAHYPAKVRAMERAITDH
jgi:dihydropteroate synthase